MENKINVLFVIPTLFSGGAERVMSFVSQNLDKNKFNVTLIVIGFEKDSKYEISGIDVKYLDRNRVSKSAIPLIKIIRKTKPKIIISAISHLNLMMGLISLIFPKIKFIGRHTIVSQAVHKFTTQKKKSLGQEVRKKLDFGYDLLDIILCQSRDMYNDMKITYGTPEHKLKVINNPITDDFTLKPVGINKGKVIKFITVARLKKFKGHERILNAISKLDFPFEYTIIGDGPEKKRIFELIRVLNLEDKIVHIPYTTEVSKYLSKSDFYLMGSYAEGFPNCLVESCAVGTPVIAFKAPGGLNEIIEDDVNGYLVDDEAEFINKLQKSRNWDPEIVRESVYKKFNKEKIIKEYENLFLELLNE